MLKITSANLWNRLPVKQLKCKPTDPLYLTRWVTKDVIFDISCYSTCMLTYMTCYFRWTKLHVGQQAMLFFNISCYSTCMLFLTCHAIFRWTHPKYYGSVSLHFSCLIGNLFHRFAEVIFNISCYSTCMLMNPPTLKIAWHVKNNMHVD